MRAPNNEDIGNIPLHKLTLSPLSNQQVTIRWRKEAPFP